MSTGYLVAESSTAGLSAADSAEFWREHVTLNQGALDFAFERGAAFWGSTIVQRADDHQVIEYSSGRVSYTRTARHARADDDRSVRFLLPVSGAIVAETDDVVARVAPGSLLALSMTSAFTLHHESGTHGWIMSAPEQVWPAGVSLATPLRLDVSGGVGVIAAATLRGLSQQRAALSEPDFRQLCGQVHDLLAACAGRQAPAGSPAIATAARQHVRVRAHDPAFTPSALARELGWSLRRLQSALHEAGTTPADLIRAARLDRAWTQLHAPERREQPISEIAHACGFGSLSTFNAAFRERYARSPREVRES